jgi:sacsin
LDPEFDYVAIADLPVVPNLSSVKFIDIASDGNMAFLSAKYDLVQDLDIEELLEGFVIPTIEGSSALTSKQRKLLDYVLEKSACLSKDWKAKLRDFKIIPSQSALGDGDLKSASELLEPNNRAFDGLFFQTESVFPKSDIFERHRGILKECDLQTAVTGDIIQSRVRYLANCSMAVSEVERVASRLIQTPITDADLDDNELIEDLRSMEWLPAEFDSVTVLMSPSDCRSTGDNELVCHVLGITKLAPQDLWRTALGWDEVIGLDVLLLQLERSAAAFNESGDFKDACSKVKRTLSYLSEHYEEKDFISELKSIQCFPGHALFYFPDKLFSAGGTNVCNLAPYLDGLKINTVPISLRKPLGIRPKPLLEDLLDVQGKLPTGVPLGAEELKVAIGILNVLAEQKLGSSVENLMGPDSKGILTCLSDLTILPNGYQQSSELEAHFAHPDITLDTLVKLHISTLRDRLLQQDLELEDMEFAPREELTTVISEGISRYPLSSTFTEFLANAEDCGATVVSWCIDQNSGKHSGVDKELHPVLGPALTVYNDAVFKEKDFEGLLRVGVGSKSNEEDSIGTHGRGVLTMYHFTDTPMILSGSSLVVLDPQQRCLPPRVGKSRNERLPGMKISITKARNAFPELLALFDGLFGYSKTLQRFNGTIFRFPFRQKGTKSCFVDRKTPLDTAETGNKLLQYFDNTAQKSLLFLQNIRQLESSVRKGTALVRQWKVSATRKESDYPPLLEVDIHASKGSDEPISVTTWLVMTDTRECPSAVKIPRTKRNKRISFGVATPKSFQAEVVHSVYCSLPTEHRSSLPVSFHATFAITSDRRTIPFQDDVRGDESAWNKWLIRDCIAPLYVPFHPPLAKECLFYVAGIL